MRTIVKRDKTKKVLMVDHPESGVLVAWKDLGRIEKKWLVRKYFKEAFDDAFNTILGDLPNIDTNKDEEEFVEIATDVAKTFLAYMCNLDPEKTANTDRSNFRELRDSSSFGKAII